MNEAHSGSHLSLNVQGESDVRAEEMSARLDLLREQNAALEAKLGGGGGGYGQSDRARLHAQVGLCLCYFLSVARVDHCVVCTLLSFLLSILSAVEIVIVLCRSLSHWTRSRTWSNVNRYSQTHTHTTQACPSPSHPSDIGARAAAAAASVDRSVSCTQTLTFSKHTPNTGLPLCFSPW